MVKMPRQVKRYSPKAGRHTMHTVERVKKRCTETGKAHTPPCKRAKKFELVDK